VKEAEALGMAEAIQRMMDELEPLQHCTGRARALSTLKVFVPEMKPWEEDGETRNAKCETRNVRE
jgi:hypothetical protein